MTAEDGGPTVLRGRGPKAENPQVGPKIGKGALGAGVGRSGPEEAFRA